MTVCRLPPEAISEFLTSTTASFFTTFVTPHFYPSCFLGIASCMRALAWSCAQPSQMNGACLPWALLCCITGCCPMCCLPWCAEWRACCIAILTCFFFPLLFHVGCRGVLSSL